MVLSTSGCRSANFNATPLDTSLQMHSEACFLSEYKPTQVYNEDDPPQWPNANVHSPLQNDVKHVHLGLVGTARSFVLGELDSPLEYCYRMAQLIWKVLLSPGYLNSLYIAMCRAQKPSNCEQTDFSLSANMRASVTRNTFRLE